MDDRLVERGEDHGAAGWTLKGGDVELFLTEQGGQHAPVTFFAASDRPVRPYYLTPWQGKQLEPALIGLLRNLRGDFFCLPFGGNADEYHGECHQCHGETAAGQWHLAKAGEHDDGVTVFEFELDTKIRPAHVVKHIELHRGHAALYVKHTVSGMSGKMPYGHHAILHMPEENEKMYFSAGEFDLGMTPSSLFSDPKNWEYQFMASGAEFDRLSAIPTRFKEPEKYDFSVYPSPAGYTDLMALLKKPSAFPAWSAAAYPQRGYLFFSLKNAAELPSTTIWVANSGRYAYPWNGVTRCFAIEETCSYFADGLKPSVEENALTRKGWKTCGEFSPDRPFTVRLVQGVARIAPDYGKTASAAFRDGKVVFTDEAGNQAEAAVDWQFLTA